MSHSPTDTLNRVIAVVFKLAFVVFLLLVVYHLRQVVRGASLRTQLAVVGRWSATDGSEFRVEFTRRQFLLSLHGCVYLAASYQHRSDDEIELDDITLPWRDEPGEVQPRRYHVSVSGQYLFLRHAKDARGNPPLVRLPRNGAWWELPPEDGTAATFRSR